MLDISNDAPAALYDLKNDLAEQKNLIADPAHAERVKRMDPVSPVYLNGPFGSHSGRLAILRPSGR